MKIERSSQYHLNIKQHEMYGKYGNIIELYGITIYKTIVRWIYPLTIIQQVGDLSSGNFT